MFLRYKETHVNEQISWDNDLLDRRRFSRLLRDVVNGCSTPFVISIEAPWGSGKTYFINLWRNLLTEEDFHVVHHDAWLNEFHSEPLIAFIDDLFPHNKRHTIKNFDNVIKTITPLLAGISTSLSTINNDLSIPVGIASSIAMCSKRLIGMFHKRSSQYTLDDLIKNFQKELVKANSYLSDKPIIYVIDELDRCSPQYCLKYLERIKHFMNIEGLIFIIAVDGTQLESAILHQYGSSIAPNEYLRKIIDIRLCLPSPPLNKYIDILMNEYGFRSLDPDTNLEDIYSLAQIIEILAKANKLPARALQQLMVYLRIMHTRPEAQNLRWPTLITTLLFLAWNSGPDILKRDTEHVARMINDFVTSARSSLKQNIHGNAWRAYEVLLRGICGNIICNTEDQLQEYISKCCSYYEDTNIDQSIKSQINQSVISEWDRRRATKVVSEATEMVNTILSASKSHS